MSTKITGTNNVSDPVAARNALLAQAANANRTPPVARVPGDPVPTQDIGAQLAAMQAMMQQLMDTNAQLAQQNAELKSSKAAPKAEKAPAIAAKNVTYTHDAKKNTLTLVIDLSTDIMDPETGLPKVSKSGATTGVAQLSGSFVGTDGRKAGVSLNVYRKI